MPKRSLSHFIAAIAVGAPAFAADESVAPVPVLPAEKALAAFVIEEGFRIELVAAEPLVQAPVAMAFDPAGRIWVAEMIGYMPDVKGTGEGEPVGRISILEDTDADGEMDTTKVFLDGLVLPRVVSFAHGGLVVSTPPELYHVEILPGDKPGKRTVIDEKYATGGNVEHQPNGFLRGIDNWFYNAKSNDRYRFFNGSWAKESTASRGQWGISQDDFGRLYYNTNSNQLQGDYIQPNLLRGNPAAPSKAGVNQTIVRDQNVHPLIPTGVNRGYKDNMLDAEGKLLRFTAACGPLVYRGGQFPAEYYQNGFVCEPSANLIKRNILDLGEVESSGKQAPGNKEFLASTDERFRPVNLANGPEGALYIVDLYRGIIQHKTYVTPYLRDYLLARGLEQPLDCGRIYRIVSTKGERPVYRFPDWAKAGTEELCRALSAPNAYTRETAQRLLVESGGTEAVPFLEKLAAYERSPLGQIHALWTLEGLGAVTPKAVAAALKSDDPQVVATAIRVSAALGGTPASPAVVDLLGQVAARTGSPLVRVHLAATLGRFGSPDAQPRALAVLADVLDAGKKDPFIHDAALSGLAGKEAALLANHPGLDKNFVARLEKIAGGGSEDESANDAPTKLTGEALAQFEIGRANYEMICMGCHQKDGGGMTALAPPLRNSEWVTGSDTRLAKILLQGLTGPIDVAGKTYDVPEIQPIMPGLKDNAYFDDEKIAAVMTYIRNTWNHEASPVDPATVAAARDALANRGADPFTADELRDGVTAQN